MKTRLLIPCLFELLAISLCAAPEISESGWPYVPAPPIKMVFLKWGQGNQAPYPAGFNIHLGTEPGKYPVVIDAGLHGGYYLQLIAGLTYYAVLNAYNAQHVEGLPTPEISFRASPLATPAPSPTPAGSPAVTPTVPEGFRSHD